MKQVVLLLCLCCIGLLHLSCKKETADEVRIRVKNTSAYRFDAAYVNTNGGENDYGSLNAGQVSEYATYRTAYSYAYIKVTINGQELRWQPIDYVGETPLQPGNYTYVVDVVDLASGRLSLRLDN
ncbi:hypothetical protein [Hymenobacter metallilatus]|uniref:Uncharacterized protein n=1 Tax=Hymenobacter metallilatus TaxID=2493666 RepID=A0A3R9N6A6_9BACT|nr:hypothetical protein [Hymenobacter metallilatus]RSK24355.1 hypothetical protein EI290_20320 [Hymenobacter metallilatus]